MSLLFSRLAAAVSCAALIAAIWLFASPAERARPAVAATSREALSGDSLARLTALIEDESASDAVREDARRLMLRLVEDAEAEDTLSSLLLAQGFDAPVVAVSDGRATVCVRAESLAPAELARICSLARACAGIRAEALKIIPIN